MYGKVPYILIQAPIHPYFTLPGPPYIPIYYLYPMFRIDTSRARNRLALILASLSKEQIAKAQRLALNDAAKWGKTQIARDIRGRYNIPLSRIYDKDPKQGLKVYPARIAGEKSSNAGQIIDAIITGGHRPVNIATLNNTRMVTATGTLRGSAKTVLNRRAKGKSPAKALFVSAEVVKGERKTIQSAFVLGVTKGRKGAAFTGEKAAIFARGSWGKPQFAFSKKRSPIATLHTVSIATAALHSNVQRNWLPKIKQRSEIELKRQVERMLKDVANQ